MNKKIILVLLVILASLSIPVVAATLAYTTTILYFNVGVANEVTVKLLGDNHIIAAGAGNATTQNIEFNSTGQNALWIHAKVTGGGSTQTDTEPIITITNRGTTSPQVNVSVNSSQAGCIDLHYSFNQSATAEYTAGTPESETQLNTTNVTLDASFTVADESIGVWLWGNFSGCAAGKAELLRIYANFP